MLTEYACTRRELSCIIGNLFTEIESPCERCGDADEITISGTTHAGSRAVLTVTRFGFTFDGDPSEVERIREMDRTFKNLFKESEKQWQKH